MKCINTQKGFTLVELAIVMTIIGLLIGGILKGQELMDNAKVSATVAQEKGYEAATTTFRDTYNSFPGDVPNANGRIPGCDGTTYKCNVPVATAGDYIIGSQTWGTTFPVQGTAAGYASGAATQADEPQMFWMHLLKANLITGVTDSSLLAATQVGWAVTHPEAKMGGGFIAGYANGTPGPGSVGLAGTGVSGTVLVIEALPLTALTTTANVQAMTPTRAAQIDRKLDDGKPATGFVQAYGVAATCFTSAAANSYNEAVNTKDCGLILRIQN